MSVPLLFLTLMAQGCSGGGDRGAAATHPQPERLPGVYAGRSPCSNCAAIETTLWIRDDGRFFLRQRLLEEAPTAEETVEHVYGLGHWLWDANAGQLVLAGRGPERRLAVAGDDGLKILSPAPIEEPLRRDPGVGPFTDRLPLDGESALTSNGGLIFRECVTGLTLPVVDVAQANELRRQQRVMNPRGKVALTSIEGRLRAGQGQEEALVVERFITIKPGTAC